MTNRLTIFAIVFLGLTAASEANDKPPRIIHEPVTAGIKGQPVYIRATVTDDKGPVKSVSLFCSVSSDSAPFKVPMRASGAGAFLGKLPNSLLSKTSQVSYYIEALDSVEQSTETPWYTISFKTAAGKTAKAVPTGEKKSSWKKPLLITAGGAALIGAGVAIAGSNGSNDDNGNPANEEDTGGLYAGSATKYLQFDSGSLISSTYSIVLNVTDSDSISTDDLQPGINMRATIINGSFTLVGPVNESGLIGSVKYNGSLAGSKITGTISGNAVTSSGTNGTYSGVFSADRQ